MSASNEILQYIPHRPPFLWVDKIVNFDQAKQSLKTTKKIPSDLDICQGHYPGNPIIPGVILSEAIFQSGAILIAKLMSNDRTSTEGTPILTRIESAKFKQLVLPGDTINMEVNLIDTIGTAWYMKGKLTKNGKLTLKVKFTCALI